MGHKCNVRKLSDFCDQALPSSAKSKPARKTRLQELILIIINRNPCKKQDEDTHVQLVKERKLIKICLLVEKRDDERAKRKKKKERKRKKKKKEKKRKHILQFITQRLLRFRR